MSDAMRLNVSPKSVKPRLRNRFSTLDGWVLGVWPPRRRRHSTLIGRRFQSINEPGLYHLVGVSGVQ
jgi:hypothetical protein